MSLFNSIGLSIREIKDNNFEIELENLNMSALEMFEADLRFKNDSKWPSGQMEERFLVKSFQFFDIMRNGFVDFNQFYRTIEKLGVVMTKSKAEAIFEEIWSQGYGQKEWLDYKLYSK